MNGCPHHTVFCLYQEVNNLNLFFLSHPEIHVLEGKNMESVHFPQTLVNPLTPELESLTLESSDQGLEAGWQNSRGGQ